MQNLNISKEVKQFEQDSFENELKKILEENGMCEEVSDDIDSENEILEQVSGAKFEIVNGNGGKIIGD